MGKVKRKEEEEELVFNALRFSYEWNKKLATLVQALGYFLLSISIFYFCFIYITGTETDTPDTDWPVTSNADP